MMRHENPGALRHSRAAALLDDLLRLAAEMGAAGADFAGEFPARGYLETQNRRTLGDPCRWWVRCGSQPRCGCRHHGSLPIARGSDDDLEYRWREHARLRMARCLPVQTEQRQTALQRGGGCLHRASDPSHDCRLAAAIVDALLLAADSEAL